MASAETYTRPAITGATAAGWIAIGLSAGLLPLLAPSPVVWGVAAAILCVPLLWYAFHNARQWPLLFCAAAILLPPLPFPVGDSGVHLSIVIAAAGILAGAARLNEWRFARSRLNFALLALTGAMALSLGFAALYSGWALAAASAARVALFGCGVYVYFSASQGPGVLERPQAERSARWLFAAAAAGAVFGCIDFVYQLPAPAGFGAQFIWLNSGVYRRAQGLFYDASALGNFCAFFLVMSVAALAYRPRGKNILPRWVACAGALLFLITLLLSFSRASLAAAIIGCLAVAFMERSRWASPRALLLGAALALAAVTIFAVTLPSFAATYWQRAERDWSSFTTAPDSVLSGRLRSWSAIGGFIAAHPGQTLAGIGYKTLPYSQHSGAPVMADNMYLSMLVETGVFGLCALLAVNAAILRVSLKASRRGSFFGTWMFCFWCGEVAQMFAGDILTFWRILPVYLWVLAQAWRESGEA